jgi:hypothetical protein
MYTMAARGEVLNQNWSNMYKAIFTNWTLMRLLRLVVGIFAIAQAVETRDVSVAIIGILLAVMAIANIGCCGAACSVPRRNETEKEVTYEEVVSKK